MIQMQLSFKTINNCFHVNVLFEPIIKIFKFYTTCHITFILPLKCIKTIFYIFWRIYYKDITSEVNFSVKGLQRKKSSVMCNYMCWVKQPHANISVTESLLAFSSDNVKVKKNSLSKPAGEAKMTILNKFVIPNLTLYSFCPHMANASAMTQGNVISFGSRDSFFDDKLLSSIRGCLMS